MSDKTDMERIGLFKESGYTTINEPYIPELSKTEAGNHKKRQILSQSSKSRCGNDDGYFLKPFSRIFEGESYTNAQLIRKKIHSSQKSKEVSNKPFIPTSGIPKMSGVGSNFGCSNTKIPYFTIETRPAKNQPPVKRNIITNPAKKGTGYGYLDICLNPYPTSMGAVDYERAKELYYRQENKLHKSKCLNRRDFIPAGCNNHLFSSNPFIEEGVPPKDSTKHKPFLQKRPFLSGLFYQNTYPKYINELYKDPEMIHFKKDAVNSSGKFFKPLPGYKSCIYRSILRKNVNFHYNNKNCKAINSAKNP